MDINNEKMNPENFQKPTEVEIEKLKIPDFLPEERSEEYLYRVSGQLRAERLIDSKFDLVKAHPQNSPEYGEFMKSIIAEVREHDKLPKQKFSEEKQAEALENIRKNISRAGNKPLPGNNESLDFAHTNQSRDFFGDRKSGKIDNKPYSATLFNIGIDTPETREYFAEKLEDKTIFLLGGGDSIKDLINSKEHSPKNVVNFDPYITSESVEKFEEGVYKSIPIPVQDSEQIKVELEKEKIPQADEIWASYSVPYYLSTPKEVEGMFDTVRNSLAENGTARIAPLSIQRENEALYKTASAEIMNQAQEIARSPDFNIFATGETMFIERLSAEMIEEQNYIEQAKNDQDVAEQAEFDQKQAEREESDKVELSEIRARLGIQ